LLHLLRLRAVERRFLGSALPRKSSYAHANETRKDRNLLFEPNGSAPDSAEFIRCFSHRLFDLGSNFKAIPAGRHLPEKPCCSHVAARARATATGT
jgi:hypothetical protein